MIRKGVGDEGLIEKVIRWEGDGGPLRIGARVEAICHTTNSLGDGPLRILNSKF